MSGIPSRVIDEAVNWAVKLDFSSTSSAQTREAFGQWLQAEPAHAIAWERVQSLKNDFTRIPPHMALDVLQTADAKRQVQGLNRRQALKLLALAGVTVATGWTVREHAPWQRLLADASTVTGEQRTLRLEDGTVIVLNTDTAVSADLRGERRLVVLRRGEILITTGPDARVARKRPFWVQTPFGTMQALGTRFVVRLDSDRVRVSVDEGAVEMHPAGSSQTAIARAGESWWLDGQSVSPARAQGFAADGWVEGVITGKDMRLADLLGELSRYRLGRIVCDQGVAELRISGTYHVRDTDQALRFLVQTQPVSVLYRTRFWVSVGPDSTR